MSPTTSTTCTDARTPTPEFRRAGWAALQATLDPLGTPRPLRPSGQLAAAVATPPSFAPG